MNWQPYPQALTLLVSALISAIIGFYAWRRRPVTGTGPLAILLLAAAQWSLTYALELLSPGLVLKVFWAKVQYFGIVTVAPAMLAFVLEYTGRSKWLNWRSLFALSIVPVVTLILVWTNDAHGLIWSGLELSSAGGYPALILEHGSFFSLVVIYSYGCLLFASFLLIRELLRSQVLYRTQVAIMLAATMVPWLANLLYLAGLTGPARLDLTPFAFALSGLLAAWGLFHYQLLSVAPVARDTVIENMSDGVLVLDAETRIVDLNPSAERTLGRSSRQLIGQHIEELGEAAERWLPYLQAGGEAHTEVTLGQDAELRIYDLRISPLRGRRGEESGHILVLRDTTDLAEAEQALFQSRQQMEDQNVELRNLSEAVEQSASMVVITDLEGTIEYVNPRFEKVSGYSAQEAISQNMRILKSGKQPDEVYRNLWETIRGGQVWRGQFHNKRKDGSLYWEQATVAPIHDDSGEIRKFVAVKEDITERKQVDEALTNLLELSRVLTTTWDLDQAVERAVEAALGIVPVADRGTLQWLDRDGETLRTVATSDEGTEQRPAVLFRPGVGVAGHALEGREIINVPDVAADKRFVPGDPEIVFRSLLVAPLVVKERSLGTLSLSSQIEHAFAPTDETLAGLVADQIAAALETAEEFTARREAEDALHRQTERLQIQHEISQSILAARLPETIAVAAISRIRQLIPCERTMVMAVGDGGDLRLLAAESGAKMGAAIDPEIYQDLLEERTLNSGWVYGAQDLGALARRSNFQQVLFEAGVSSYVVVPLKIQDELVGMLNVESSLPGAFSSTHITIATEVAASLAVATRQARLYELAQQEIADRMQAEEALRSYTDELEIRNAELDAFAHTVAHDLKTPVSTLVGYSDMLALRREKMPEELVQEFLETLARSALKISTIIDELLLLSSVRGMDDVEPVALDMERVVAEAEHRMRYTLAEYEVSLILPSRWPVALGYGPWIEEVWVNFVSNALKYGGDPAHVELGSDKTVAPGVEEESFDGQTRFWVRDNGKGLTPEEQGRLFTPFERLHQTRVEGHGLGLSIVQRIVQRLGGHVGVESDGEPGQGSTFYFTLPTAPDELDQNTSLAQTASSEAAPTLDNSPSNEAEPADPAPAEPSPGDPDLAGPSRAEPSPAGSPPTESPASGEEPAEPPPAQTQPPDKEGDPA